MNFVSTYERNSGVMPRNITECEAILVYKGKFSDTGFREFYGDMDTTGA